MVHPDSEEVTKGTGINEQINSNHIMSEANDEDDDSASEIPPILTTTNSYNTGPISICSYRSRHVQLCGRTNSVGN